MALIILKGTDRRLECSLSQCENVNKMKERKLDPKTPLNISGTLIELGDIRYAIPDKETDRDLVGEQRMKDNSNDIAKFMQDFEDDIKKYANGKLEEKLQFNLRIAKMYCYALTGGDIEQYKPELKLIFIEELKKEKLVVNPTKYIKLFKVDEVYGKKGLVGIKYIVRQLPMRLMENYLQNVYSVLKK